jgi:hypothetical protein
MEKLRSCPTPGCQGKIRSDEIGRQHNGRVDGKQVCPDCVLREIYGRFGL